MTDIKHGDTRLGYFPILGKWDVCEAKVHQMHGMEVVEWVDQWQNDPYETTDGTVDEPVILLPLPEPPE